MSEIIIKVDNTDEFLAELPRRIEAGLTAIGIQAANYAADKSPVDTGRLRDSMTSKMDGDQTVIVGTDVYYGVYQELGTRSFSGHHMIRDAGTQHTAEYKRMLEAILKA